MKYNGLDLYNATISEIEDGIIFISLVDEPAVERDFVCFNKDQEKVRFRVENEEKRIITGVVMLANTPILRINGDYQYYISYSPETLQKMAEKCLFEGTFRNVDLMHDNRKVEGINLVELFIKDDSKGISPNFIEDIPDGSLMASFHVENDELWNEIKNGEFLKGFSLEGFFTMERMHKAENNNENNIDNKMKNLFKKLLVKFASVETDKGTLYYAEELAVGVDIFVDNENVEIAPDGEYEAEDKIIVVKDGKVEEIREKEVEEPEAAEPEVDAEEEVVVEEPEVSEPEKDEIAEIKAEIEAMKAEIEALKEALAKVVEQPQAEPIAEEFEKAKSSDEKMSKAERKALLLRKR